MKRQAQPGDLYVTGSAPKMTWLTGSALKMTWLVVSHIVPTEIMDQSGMARGDRCRLALVTIEHRDKAPSQRLVSVTGLDDVDDDDGSWTIIRACP